MVLPGNVLMVFWGQAMLCFQLRDYLEYFSDLIPLPAAVIQKAK